MHLSYAQNLEDYHLSLLFAGEPTGTYVDVGGGHPVADNVSFYFYLMGWRGLIVEPQTKLATIYAHVRPRDHTVSMLAGAKDGEIDFHTVDKLHGFSTSVEANASAASAFGVGYTTTRLPVRRLSTLLDEAKISKIDFLKTKLVRSDTTIDLPDPDFVDEDFPDFHQYKWSNMSGIEILQGESFEIEVVFQGDMTDTEIRALRVDFGGPLIGECSPSGPLPGAAAPTSCNKFSASPLPIN